MLNRYVYILTIVMLSLGTYARAEMAQECKEGQVFDPVKKICVDAPVKAPVETPQTDAK